MGDEAQTMTVVELAQRCGIDSSTAFRYLHAGKLPGVQAGSRWIIDRQRVERYLAGQEDATGRPLFHAPSPPHTESESAITLAPGMKSDMRELGLAWLRGAHAALGLLIAAGSLLKDEDET